MTETIDLMKRHVSVRRFKKEAIPESDLNDIIEAGRAASTWKNFQAYSIVVLRSKEKKKALFELLPQPAIDAAACILVFVGDHHRLKLAADLHQAPFDAKGAENLLISSVDAALAGQNSLLAAESLGYGGVVIGMIRHQARNVAELLKLPDYTYPVFCIALGVPDEQNAVKPRFPKEAVVFEEEYQEQTIEVIRDFDKVQADYANGRQTDDWSERVVAQYSQAEYPETRTLLEKHKLL